MANDELKLAGMTPSGVFETLREQGVDAHDAAIIVGSWIHEVVGAFKRTFYYKTPFPDAKPDCQPTFARTFQHVDWIDGESVVQAEQTTAEDGFNTRFHKIEADLDGLGRDVTHAYACMADMRAGLAKLLEEVRVELNRLGDLVDKPQGVRPDVVAPIIKDPVFMGSTKLFGKNVMMWKTDSGMMFLPAVKDLAGDPLRDPRIVRVGDLVRIIETDDALRAHFANRDVPLAELLDRFGTVPTGDGRVLRDLVAILPPDAKFASLSALADDVAAREAAALRTSDLAGVAMAAAFGTAAAGPAADIPVARVETIPADVRNALAASGVATIGNLADADPATVTANLERAGVRVTRGDVATWVGAARTLRHLGR